MFAPRQTPAVSRNDRTQDISNRGVYFVVGDDLKPGVVLDPTITLLVETTRVGGLSIYIAGKVGRAEGRSEGSIGKFRIADVIGHYEIVT
jgi:hypothetical protein